MYGGIYFIRRYFTNVETACWDTTYTIRCYFQPIRALRRLLFHHTTLHFHIDTNTRTFRFQPSDQLSTVMKFNAINRRGEMRSLLARVSLFPYYSVWLLSVRSCAASVCVCVWVYLSYFLYVRIVYFPNENVNAKALRCVKSEHPDFPFLHDVRMRNEHTQMLRLIRKHNSNMSQNTVITDPFEMCVCIQNPMFMLLSMLNGLYLVVFQLTNVIYTLPFCLLHSLRCVCVFFSLSLFLAGCVYISYSCIMREKSIFMMVWIVCDGAFPLMPLLLRSYYHFWGGEMVSYAVTIP